MCKLSPGWTSRTWSHETVKQNIYWCSACARPTRYVVVYLEVKHVENENSDNTEIIVNYRNFFLGPLPTSMHSYWSYLALEICCRIAKMIQEFLQRDYVSSSTKRTKYHMFFVTIIIILLLIISIDPIFTPNLIFTLTLWCLFIVNYYFVNFYITSLVYLLKCFSLGCTFRAIFSRRRSRV